MPPPNASVKPSVALTGWHGHCRVETGEMEGENAPIGEIVDLCLVALAMPAGAQAQSVADFYKGKTVTVIVGYTAGGGYDIYARALARHMGRHLPGNPNFIVQNLTGAGSLNAANNLYNVAAKDGTVFGTFGRGLAMEPLIGTARVQFDATKFTWLGSGTNEISLCATWHTSPVKTWQDALKLGFTVGGEGAGSDPDTYAAFVRNVFGVKLKLVTGYHGTTDIILAIERGEVDGRCGWSWSSVKSTRPNWIPEKKLNYLVHMSEVKAPELAAHSDHPRIRQRRGRSRSCGWSPAARPWAGRSRRRPACPPTAPRRCAAPSTRR